MEISFLLTVTTKGVDIQVKQTFEAGKTRHHPIGTGFITNY
jgi:hypothetical protein